MNTHHTNLKVTLLHWKDYHDLTPTHKKEPTWSCFNKQLFRFWLSIKMTNFYQQARKPRGSYTRDYHTRERWKERRTVIKYARTSFCWFIYMFSLCLPRSSLAYIFSGALIWMQYVKRVCVFTPKFLIHRGETNGSITLLRFMFCRKYWFPKKHTPAFHWSRENVAVYRQN